MQLAAMPYTRLYSVHPYWWKRQVSHQLWPSGSQHTSKKEWVQARHPLWIWNPWGRTHEVQNRSNQWLHKMDLGPDKKFNIKKKKKKRNWIYENRNFSPQWIKLKNPSLVLITSHIRRFIGRVPIPRCTLNLTWYPTLASPSQEGPKKDQYCPPPNNKQSRRIWNELLRCISTGAKTKVTSDIVWSGHIVILATSLYWAATKKVFFFAPIIGRSTNLLYSARSGVQIDL